MDSILHSADTRHEAADFRVGQQVIWLRPLGGSRWGCGLRGQLLPTPATVKGVGKRVTIETERGTVKRVERRQLETV